MQNCALQINAVTIVALLFTTREACGLSAEQAIMLNSDVLQMLMNGGFDARQPARIFLPPKYYSSVLYDRGHQDPEEIFHNNLQLMMEAVYDDSLLFKHSPLSQANAASPPAGGATLNRPNSISYSDDGRGNRNKGSEALRKNTVTNFKSSFAPTSSAVLDQSQSSVSEIVSGSPAGGNGQSFGSSRDQSREAAIGYNLRSALPGEPDVDYPILGHIPETSFKCHGRQDGYYADVEARCQVFRVCANTDDSGSGFAFLCPNGTLFNQKYFVCDWYMNVRCEESENYYNSNKDMGKTTTDFGKMMGTVMSMVGYPMISSLKAAAGSTNNVKPSPLNDDAQSNRKGGYGSNTADSVSKNQPHFGQHGNEHRIIPSGVDVKSGVFQSKFNKESSYQSHKGKDVTHPSSQVYVSSLGTLSTDPQSGFDPVKSTFLVPPRLTGGLKQQYNGEANLAPSVPKPQFELLMGKLLKTWTDMGYAKAPSLNFRPPVTILPPSGVLPPSTFPFGTNRLWVVAGRPQVTQLPSVLSHPNPAPVQNVIRVNKVFVAPQTYRPSSYVTFPQALIPQSTAPGFIVRNRPPVVNPSLVQLARRSDVALQRILRPAPPLAPARRGGTGYDVEIVPSNGYYLNNDQEKNSYFDLLNTHTGPVSNSNYFAGLSSYNVPINSVGPRYNNSP
ncbi:uncharacterized protein LOC134215866 isoform X2 [Armigeres subalbatus]|uniref:uncharacterized protein LOC134215866 isoform X2 n=1 Tax=Armigeres subalbatus TaxID=124917 RepID=UPI002ED4FE63